MKKVLLTFSAIAALAFSANAQTRLALYEEFSGENCGPCAASNPGLWTRISANPTKVLLIKYQSPIPSAGPIYNLYHTFTDNRLNYYSVPFAPYGRNDGKIMGVGQSSPGHVDYMVQDSIDAEYARASPFNITVSHAWSVTGDSVTTTVNVTCVTAFAPAAASMKLRIALLEHLVYASAPGTNGETDFHNVVREMYPDANGTTISNTWTVGQTQTYTITGRVPSWVDKSGVDTRMVAWIQNDNDKVVAQAGVSAHVNIPVDVASASLAVPSSLACAGASTNANVTVTLKNTGTTALTSAKVFYNIDGGSWQSQNWTGNVASGATTTVNIAGITVTPGQHVISDSVASPNGQNDINAGNNVASGTIWVQNTTPNALPLTTGFENAGTMPTNYMLYDANANGNNWALVKGTSTNIGHNNSTYLIYHANYAFAAGEVNYAILPTPSFTSGARAIDFYVAYAQYQNENDRLDLVYSTDCGVTWTSLWNKQGTALSTAPATTNSFVPTQSQWRLESVDISSIPTGAMMAFKATSAYGNNLFLDDINVHTGAPTGISEVIASDKVELAPNPASSATKLTFTLSAASNVTIQMYDAVGRVVNTIANQHMTAGQQQFDINTSALAAGVYNIKIATEKGAMTQRLSVVK